MCDYQGYEFGASYLDSICLDGYLYDADDCDEEGRLYLHEDEEHIPCPLCNSAKHKIWSDEQKVIREETKVW